MEILNALIVALLASGAVGMAVAFVIQLGKLFAPKWFPNESADNWRLGLVVLTAVAVSVVRAFGYTVEIGQIENVATSLAALGATLYPLFVLLANWIAKQTYKNVLRGVSGIGKSYTAEAKG
jgi:hypothetical protein